MTRSINVLLAAAAAAVLFSCGQKASLPVASACDTLSRETVGQVQGEAVVDIKGSQATSGDISISQCFYKLPTFSKSVNLEVTQGSRDAIDAFWNKRFRDRGMSEEQEEELEREKKEGKTAPETDQKQGNPQAVAGLGDEAFWTASQINGALFVRRGNAVYRINLGGAEDSASKLEKATALANSFVNKKD